MKLHQHLGTLLLLGLLTSCGISKKNPFWASGEMAFDVQELFFDERFPNIVVGTDGTLIASWGREKYRVRRSEDGGKSWGPEIMVANPGFQGGGTTVDENSGDVLLFVEEHHPVAPLTVYRSKDLGKTWAAEKVKIEPNSLGHIPSMHMNEHGITLQHGQHAGRLIRPTRYYGGGNDRAYWDDHYTNAIFSDDGGRTWQASEPFPANGTGEAAIVELEDGRLYYNSRRHKSTDGLNPRRRYSAWSDDGGKTWEDLALIEALPDGDQDRDYGLMGGLVRLPVDGQDILLFSNIESPKGRHGGTVWASFDGGKTWPVKKLVDAGSFAYSSMVAGRKGTPSEGLVYLLYESDGGAKLARFNLAWLTDGRDWREFIK
ncbi:sialidase family protein [Flavilitoribacter nigricans]|uniref:exo-alpha-sialidase n=1 Tax=Flavilitoribacter nigricans (strain ATCC 23147 / DSM 23189 / NBRC 102662 / NCIMB 1420 / SS-2) TaxID=1122177 RepID=A0A2D0NCM3_FLAN2|nr:sialidase family protein [Flavilitoribacter nigricans]PHN05929.1 glycosyl hydrolase [Flavilitoribacter nigricans DSM 23189 = NBRC 102662]